MTALSILALLVFALLVLSVLRVVSFRKRDDRNESSYKSKRASSMSKWSIPRHWFQNKR